jgi:hypothetical protein
MTQLEVDQLFVLTFLLGSLFGFWAGRVVQRDKDERRRRANIRARYNHPSNR